MEYLDNNFLKKGIYGIEDCNINKIVYIGSTKANFATRTGRHIQDYQKNRHCNKKLVELFKSKKFRFVILESGENYTSKKLLDRERYYSEKYNVYEEGFCINIGGGKLKDEEPTQWVKLFEYTDDVINARKYIKKYWLNKRIDKKQRKFIGNTLKDKYNIKFTRFKIVIRQLGFEILTYKDQVHWYIKDFLSDEKEERNIFQKYQGHWLYTPDKLNDKNKIE